jgi:hypothetical protein
MLLWDVLRARRKWKCGALDKYIGLLSYHDEGNVYLYITAMRSLPLYTFTRPSWLWLLALSLSSTTLVGQVTLQPKPITPYETGIIYNEEQAFTFRVLPRGLSFGGYKGKIQTYYRTTFYYGEVGYLKHHKEVRQSNELAAILRGQDTPRPYVFGKQNNFYTLRGGYGVKRYYSEKARRKGLAVALMYQGGFTLGALKPNYLRLIRRGENNLFQISPERYSEANADVFLDPFSIYGGAPMTMGFRELAFIPGVHGMGAVHFAFGAFEEYVMAIDAGIMFDAFPRKVPIMVADNQAYFLNLFLNLHIGKRK